MHRRLLSLATAAVTLGALAVTAQTASAAVSPRAAFTAFTTEGASGSYLLPSGAKEYTGDAVTVTAGSDSLTFSATSGSWTALLDAPSGAPLAVGTYTTGRFADPGVARLDVFGDGRGCNQLPGSIVISEITRDEGTGTITSFAGTYSVQCEGTAAPNVGELRYGSTVDYERFGRLGLGRTSPAHTVTVTADAETTFGAAVVQGQDSSTFAVGADDCSGTTLAAGDSCSISVTATDRELGGRAGVLRLPSASGDRLVGLTASFYDTPEGTYTPVAPARVLDTRKAVGVTTKTPIGDGRYVDVQVTGKKGVPSTGVAAVVLNVTAISPTTRGYLTVYPASQSRPTASSVNFGKGWVGANLVTVPIAAGGKVRFYNADGSTHVAADVVGFYHSASSTADPAAAAQTDFGSTSPERIVDTRTADWGKQPLPGRSWLWQAIDFGPYNSRVKAFAVNVTVVKPATQGHLTTFDGNGANIPSTSTLNFTAGRTVPNMAVIKTSPCGADCAPDGYDAPRFGVYNASLGSAHIVVDLVGVYFNGEAGDHGWRFKSLTSPQRFVDSRKGQGLTSNLGSNSSRVVLTPSSIAGYNTMAVVTNTTAAQPTSTTVFTLWANDGSPRPTVSNLNPYAGQVVSNMTITEVWTKNDFRIHNLAGTAPVVIDAAGTMEFYPALAPGSATGHQSVTGKGSSADRPAGAATLAPKTAEHGLGRVG